MTASSTDTAADVICRVTLGQQHWERLPRSRNCRHRSSRNCSCTNWLGPNLRRR